VGQQPWNVFTMSPEIRNTVVSKNTAAGAVSFNTSGVYMYNVHELVFDGNTLDHHSPRAAFAGWKLDGGKLSGGSLTSCGI